MATPNPTTTTTFPAANWYRGPRSSEGLKACAAHAREITGFVHGATTTRALCKLGLLSVGADINGVVNYFDNLYKAASDSPDFDLDYVYPAIDLGYLGLSMVDLCRRSCAVYGEGSFDLWDYYSLAELNLRPTNMANPEIRWMLVGGEDNIYGEKGLYFPDHTVVKLGRDPGQRKLADSKIRGWNKSKAHQGYELIHFDPVAYILLNAVRFEAGLRPLDRLTFTRFTNVSDKGVGDSALVPEMSCDSNGPNFEDSSVYEAWISLGVRFSVVQKA